MGKLWHKRLHYFEAFDTISLVVVPRFKTSGLSGDEWRQSVVAVYYFKGKLVHQASYRDMQNALMYLPHDWLEAQMPIPKEVLILEETTCDQPSCPNKAVGRLKLKRETDSHGNWLVSEGEADQYRKFCLVHIERGDCSREDADENYIPLDRVSALDSQNAFESPATFGGVIDLTGEDRAEGSGK